ncbi:MAG: orotidine-5'-phosphate decarboxylase [Calditrichia bacterium]
MFAKKLNQMIEERNSLLCVGLDTAMEKIPAHLRQNAEGLLRFNREIIEATLPYCSAYKLNIAFYEALGIEGWRLLKKTRELIPDNRLVIADAKRGDIGNTSRKYAETFFRTFDFDAITVAPYMGSDSVEPFLEFSDRGVFILCLTSNSGSRDFQYLPVNGRPLYELVAEKISQWNKRHGNCGLVVGATHPEEMRRIRQIATGLPILIPGIGAQGGDLATTVQAGCEEGGPNALINVSRAIIYADDSPAFAKAAAKQAAFYQQEINRYYNPQGGK